MWRGGPEARIAAIGEAPGADEDEYGEPFVGAAGRKFNQLLKEASVLPDDIFIMNMLGCRPPGNRKPKPEELKACRRRMRAMLRIVRPKVLLLVGATAARLAGVTAISKARGKPVEVEIPTRIVDRRVEEAAVYPAIPTFHPSYLLRMGGSVEIHQQMLSDIIKARNLSCRRH